MAFIGIPKTTISFRLFEMQAQFALTFLNGDKVMPSRSEMLNDMHIQNQIYWDRGHPKSKTHDMILKSAFSVEQREYLDQLAEVGGVPNIPLVFDKIIVDIRKRTKENPREQRKYRYYIIDDNTFTKERCEV